MSDLTHLFKINQQVKVNFDGVLYNGTVTQTSSDHIIVDVPRISNHCYFEHGNLDMVFPEYNF